MSTLRKICFRIKEFAWDFPKVLKSPSRAPALAVISKARVEMQPGISKYWIYPDWIYPYWIFGYSWNIQIALNPQIL